MLANVPLQFYGRGFSLLDTSIIPTPARILSPKEKYVTDLDFKSRNEKPMRPFTAKTKSKMQNQVESLVELIEDDNETLFSKSTKRHPRVQSANPRARAQSINHRGRVQSANASRGQTPNAFPHSLQQPSSINNTLSAVLKQKLMSSDHQDASTHYAATKRVSVDEYSDFPKREKKP